MKALARYQVILLSEQRHIRCEQLAQSCCPNNAAAGVEPSTSWSRVQCPTTKPPNHLGGGPSNKLLPHGPHRETVVYKTRPGYESLNRYSFSRFLKVSRDGAEVTSTGRSVHVWALATRKGRHPTVGSVTSLTSRLSNEVSVTALCEQV